MGHILKREKELVNYNCREVSEVIQCVLEMKNTWKRRTEELKETAIFGEAGAMFVAFSVSKIFEL